MSFLPAGWMNCVVSLADDAHVILEPECWAGMLMADHVNEERCPAEVWLPLIKCGLPRGHECDHLACTAELIAETGTLKPVSWVSEGPVA